MLNEILSLHSEAIINPPASAKLYKDSWEFDLYVNELNGAIKSDIFKHQSWIQFYYTWAGFQNYNLVVRVNVLLQSCLTLFFLSRTVLHSTSDLCLHLLCSRDFSYLKAFLCLLLPETK